MMTVPQSVIGYTVSGIRMRNLIWYLRVCAVGAAQETPPPVPPPTFGTTVVIPSGLRGDLDQRLEPAGGDDPVVLDDHEVLPAREEARQVAARREPEVDGRVDDPQAI